MSYSPQQWTDKDWNSYHTLSNPSTPVSSWGTSVVHSPQSSYHSGPGPYTTPYAPTSPSSGVYSPSQTSLNRIPSLPPSQPGSSAGGYYNGSVAHPILRPGAGHSLRFDVSNLSFPPALPIDPQTSAFHPPLTQLTLEFQGLHPHWKVKIVVAPGSYVSVYHIIEQIYRHCCSELRRDQDLEIPSTKRAVANSYFQTRVHQHQSQARSPMLLLDILGADTLFMGVAPKTQDPSTWIVQLGSAGFAR